MPDKKIIAVIGATGAQGGGLVRAIAADPNGPFTARAITRKVDSDKAKAIAKQAEVVAADLDDPAGLTKAFRGAHGAYCVTNFWEHFSPEKETAHAAALARAAKEAGVKHVVWSTLEDTRRWVPLDDARMPTLQGKYKVPHFDAKGQSDRFFAEAGVPTFDGKGEVDHVWADMGVPTTLLLTSFYWDNFIHFGMGPKKGPDGRLALTLPMGNARLPGIAVEDIGRCAYGLFKKGGEYIGKTVAIAGEHLTGAEMAAAFTRALGRPVVYNAVTPEQYRSFGFPGAEDLGNMFQFKCEFQEAFCGPRDPKVARALNSALQTFDAWLAANKSRIPLD
jgi:uncharacterized protein YbjT (DUF2867 family)